MENKNLKITNKDILALEAIIELIRIFYEKNPIRHTKFNINRIKEKILNLSDEPIGDRTTKFKKISKRIELIIWKEIRPKIYYIFGGHGGVIIKNIGFCEFDSPEFALYRLIDKMKFAVETNMPYNIEIAISCFEWLKYHYPNEMEQFLDLFNKGRFEIINPSYSQPYNLIVGEESNIKQFEFGLKVLNHLGLSCNNYYCSEVSLHPQIPQILDGFNIEYCSLRTRLLGTCPSTNSGIITWLGLDNSKITTITDQSGIFNGEFWHGTFFTEIPELLFQAVSRPFMKHLIFSSIEDFVNPLPLQEEVWRISAHSEIFGKFVSCSELYNIIKTDGEFKYSRDEFALGEYIFIQNELFLNNKRCEVALITSEIINCILGLYFKTSNDSLLEELWKELLLTQAHDNYAVPYVQPGDYSAQQLSKEEYEKLDIPKEKISISDLSIKIQRKILSKCDAFINENLKKITDTLTIDSKISINKGKDIIVLNPTIYPRQDIVSVPLKLENENNWTLTDEAGKILEFTYQNSAIKFIPNIPSMGYKIFSFIKTDHAELMSDNEFLYDLQILEDNQTVNVSFKQSEVYRIKFGTPYDYALSLKAHIQNKIEQKLVIKGEIKDKVFTIEITQYKKVNRLEFIVSSEFLDEIIVIPSFKISKSLINYPFGIEVTKRSSIQTLDFLWLIGENNGIMYIQKNSQQFIINRRNFEIHNLLKKRGRYEFSISLLPHNEFHSAYEQVYTYKFNLIGMVIQGNHEYVKKSDSWLSINPEMCLINLWRRENGSFLRMLNPSIQKKEFSIEGLLIDKNIKEIDFKYNFIKELRKNTSIIDAWKIKTLQY